MSKDPLAEMRKREELDGKVWPFKLAMIISIFPAIIVFEAIGDTAKTLVWYWAGFMVVMLIIIAIMDIRNSRKLKAWRKENE